MSSVGSPNILNTMDVTADAQRKSGASLLDGHEQGDDVQYDYSHLRRDKLTTIVILEPRLLLRELVSECLRGQLGSPIIADVQSASTFAEWVEAAHRHPPTVVVLCCLGPTSDEKPCWQEMQEIRQVFPSLPIIVMADSDRLDDVHRAMEGGARGYIPTNTPAAVVIGALRLVVAGGVYIPASCLRSARPDEEARGTVNRRKLPMFTTRQAAVVDALRKGKANKLIAYELNMRESTVKVHVRNIMKRLNAKNRTEVAYKASKLMGEDGA